VINTVSQTYAKEIQTPEYGCGLEGILKYRSGDLYGIVNGVDYSEWSPEQDRLIPARYSPKNLSEKSKNKQALFKECGFSLKRLSWPALGMISRLADQKGFDLLSEIATGLKFNSDLYADFYQWIHQKAALNSRFAASLFLFERMPNDPELRNRIIRYWSGDKMGAGEIKKYLKACREPVTYKIDSITGKELALQSFKFAARLIMAAGYSGWVLLIDEVELVSRYSLMQRAKSYAELARWMGKLEESNYAGLAVVSSITADFQSKVLEGIDDFEKVPGRLRVKGTESDLLLASQAERGMRVIQNELARLKAPDSTTLDQTYEKVRSIHANAYDWNPPPVPSVERLGSTRMRQYIRGWITEWDLKRLDREYNPEIEVGIVEQDYSEDKNLEVETEGNETNSAQE